MKDLQIVKVIGREIIDSRGNPTVEAEVTLADGSTGNIPFDYAYICLGMQPEASLLAGLLDKFQNDGVEVLNIGNSAKARRMIDGVREGRNILEVLDRLSYFD